MQNIEENEIFFTRATTPGYTVYLTDENDEPLDLSGYEDIRITIKQFENTLVSKSTKAGTATIDGSNVLFELTQEETLRFQPGTAYIQPHLLTKEAKAYADKDIQKIRVYDILDGGAI